MNTIFKNRQRSVLLVNSRCDISCPKFIESCSQRRSLFSDLKTIPLMWYLIILTIFILCVRPDLCRTKHRTIHIQKSRGIFVGIHNIEKIYGYMPNTELFRLFTKVFRNKRCCLRSILIPLLEKRVLDNSEDGTCDNLRLFSSVLSIFNFGPYPIPKQEYGQSMIKLDSERTFLTADSQNKLINLLQRLCLSSGVSYVQGMNYIAAHALKNTKSLDDSFRLCYFIISEMRYGNLIDNECKQLKMYNAKIEKTVKKQLPVLWERLNSAGFDTAMLTTQWLMTMFCQILTPKATNKLWILFFLSGWTVLMDAAFHLLAILSAKFINNKKTDWCEFLMDYKQTITKADEKRLLGQLRTKWGKEPHIKKTQTRGGIRLLSVTNIRG